MRLSLPVFKFETVDEVIQLANNTEFGLSAYFYANNLQDKYGRSSSSRVRDGGSEYRTHFDRSCPFLEG